MQRVCKAKKKLNKNVDFPVEREYNCLQKIASFGNCETGIQ